ncbi:RNA polymerase II subunit A C-terminal domain phosphatase [Toxocara canis]|uniref:RNA polymerase II subunit A C-terminal domain phosphatase n=2 Tax=Toxocara canis TaxID=6265 RepID=A0A0B2UUM0_TOXCA|nr:RNA polymerase II subunit A C-terminal domain phosphatase [Toxocara canis]
MNELYEMHIISYGERQYAHKIAEILDPDKRYFGHRILSRDELFSAMYKTGNMKALFPCGDQLIAIIDDRPDVWQYSDALIQVKPYRFFKEIGDINAPAITNVQEQSLVQERIAQVNVEGDGDETLEYVATVLTRIHTAFYAHYDKNTKDRVQDVVHYKLRGTDFYTKIRPYARTFLRRMNELYEMHIISYGERQYAHKIAEILDPDKRYFGHRILSRDELFSAMYKTGNMKALFPCGDQLIAIIDDRPDVWQYSDALIQVKPYRFFKEIGDINAPAITNVQEQSLVQERIAQVNVEGDGDETLEYVATVLTRIHTAFYAHYDKNTKDRVQVSTASYFYALWPVLHL